MKMLSIIVPCYNERENIADFYKEVNKNGDFFRLREIEVEFCFVDDGSTDDTRGAVKALQASDSRIRYFALSRNFGKEAALFAGLSKARGDYVVVMDADLQDPPALLPQMLEFLWEGYDSVATRRVNRKGEPPIRSLLARTFYRLINRISDIEFVDGARDYRIMTRQMVDSILELREYHRFTKGIFSWVGYQTKWLEFENVERTKGETKWSFWRLFTYSIEGITSFSTMPLAIASYTGLFFCFFAFVLIIVVVVRAALFGDPTAGWPSMVSIILFVGGLQLFCVGIIGQYMGKTYMETKNRPIYLLKEES